MSVGHSPNEGERYGISEPDGLREIADALLLEVEFGFVLHLMMNYFRTHGLGLDDRALLVLTGAAPARRQRRRAPTAVDQACSSAFASSIISSIA